MSHFPARPLPMNTRILNAVISPSLQLVWQDPSHRPGKLRGPELERIQSTDRQLCEMQRSHRRNATRSLPDETLNFEKFHTSRPRILYVTAAPALTTIRINSDQRSAHADRNFSSA